MDERWTRWLIIVNVVVGIGAGVWLFLVPVVFLGVLGIEPDGAGTALARLYGAELLGFSLATWLSRTAPVPRPIILGHVVNEALTAVALAMAASGGMGNVLVWAFAVTAAAFAAGFALVAIGRRGASSG